MSPAGVEGRKPSVLRFLIVAICLAAVVAAGTRWAVAIIAETRAESGTTWFSPYVDVTLTPLFHFEDPAEQASGSVVLGFIVADPADGCAPSWGGYYSLDAAARALDLDRRVVRLRERGGDAVVSFGGALNKELAISCEDPDRLVAAYRSVIARYDASIIDLDIEGTSISDEAANARRAAAITRLQREEPELRVWLTLPVAPHGLDAPAIALIESMVQGGVILGGVNVMTMNFGGSRDASASMHEASVQALLSTWQQLDGVYRRAGSPRSEAEIWRMIGATPMIGQNDVAGDVFTLRDAQGLAAFARSVDLGRVSFWSANRDVQCGAAISDSRPSNTCSGVSQEPMEFAEALAQGGPADDSLPAATPVNAGRADGQTRDDPRTSPYPLWRSPKAYEEGAKVVWQGRVYQAKWWTQGNQPDAPVKHVWETPWRYLGPVLESDRVAVGSGKTPSDGSRPRWAGETVYVAGNEVEFEGKAFRAKWWNQGDSPEEDPDQPYDHPWEYLGEVEPKGK